jgi:serine/threonine protein kinase
MTYEACRSLEELVRLLPSFVVQKKDFKTGRRIGKGAFSIVYAAVQKSTGRVCALKVLNYKTLKRERLQLFEREVRALAACHSPFVLRFVGFTTKHPFTIVTEYVPNGCLYDALRPPKGGHVLTGTEKTIIGIGLAVGLRRLHEIGIVHRDMKSLNILLDHKLRPQICDFGLSRSLLDEAPMSGHVGTANWMAPELFESRRYDEKVDLYAYAMVLWELLSGHSPFSGKTSEQIEDIVCSGGRPIAPGDTPRGLQDVISACWNRDPQRRPSLDRILSEFSSHRARFRECDDAAVDAFLRELLLDAPEAPECSGDLPEHLKSDRPDVDDEVFPAVGSPTFAADVREVASKLSIENCNGFFVSLRQCFAAEMPASHVLGILSALVSLFEKDRSFVAVFTSHQLHKTLPMHVCQELVWVFFHIFAAQPEAVG